MSNNCSQEVTYEFKIEVMDYEEQVNIDETGIGQQTVTVKDENNQTNVITFKIEKICPPELTLPEYEAPIEKVNPLIKLENTDMEEYHDVAEEIDHTENIFKDQENYKLKNGLDDEIKQEIMNINIPVTKAVKESNINCKLCQYISISEDDMVDHLQSLHCEDQQLNTDKTELSCDDTKKNQCPHCPYKASKKGLLNRHINCVHGEKNFKCNFCEFASASKSNLKIHVDAIHLNIKNHQCQFCDYVTARKVSLVMHIESFHFNEKKFKCNLCSYESARKNCLNRHMNNVHFHIKEYQCPVCEFATASKQHLNQHVEAIHSEEKKYKCSHCDYAATAKRYLKKHVDSIHLDKKHHCHLCDYSSAKKETLINHVKAIHLNIRNYHCEHCDFKTSRKDSLGRHVKRVHMKEKQEPSD